MFGNNEDFNNPNTFVWVVPASKETYGGVYLGYQYGLPQGGINEKGLAFDALALPEASLNPHNEMPFRGESDSRFMAKFMSQCATVEEAIAFAKEYNWGSKISFQVLFADASGDAVIISAGQDGNLAFTRKPEGDSYLVGTNFNRAYPENRFGDIPCLRYEKTEAMLTQMSDEAIDGVNYFQQILEAVHVESADQNTLYSNIFDLRNGQIYLYYWHQYDEVVVLNVQEQIQRNFALTRLSDLFSEETLKQAEDELQQHKVQAARNEWLNRNGKVVIVGAIVIGIILLALSIFFLVRRKKYHQNNSPSQQSV